MPYIIIYNLYFRNITDLFMYEKLNKNILNEKIIVACLTDHTLYSVYLHIIYIYK